MKLLKDLFQNITPTQNIITEDHDRGGPYTPVQDIDPNKKNVWTIEDSKGNVIVSGLSKVAARLETQHRNDKFHSKGKKALKDLAENAQLQNIGKEFSTDNAVDLKDKKSANKESKSDSKPNSTIASQTANNAAKEATSKIKSEWAVGDIVTPLKGQHTDEPHEVIHVFDNGDVNIRPKNMLARDVQYKGGAATVKPTEIKRTDMKVESLLASIETGVYEGVSPYKINAKVKIISGPKDVIGKEGYIAEIRTSAGGERKFTIDYETDSGRITSIQMSVNNLKLIKAIPEALKSEDPKGFGRKMFNKIIGTPSGQYKYKIGDIVSYNMVPSQKDGTGTGKITKLLDGHHYLINGMTVNQNEITLPKVAKHAVAEARLDELNPETLDSYRGKRVAQHDDHSAAHPAGEKASKGILAAYRKSKLAKSTAANKTKDASDEYSDDYSVWKKNKK